MIVLGTPSVTLNFGIPDWAVLLITGLMILSYYIGKRQGRKAALQDVVEDAGGKELMD